MQQLKFRIRPKGGSDEIITAELVDVIAWEEHYQKPSTAMAGDDAFVRDSVWLAWHAVKRQGKTTLEFMDWVASLEDMEIQPDAPLAPSENPPLIG